MVKKRVPKKIIKIDEGYTRRLTTEEDLPIERVLIFGSRIKGKIRFGSDIDVCIISPRFKNPLVALKFLWQKRNRKEVIAGLEPVGFSKKDFEEGSTFIEEIKKTGIIIK